MFTSIVVISFMCALYRVAQVDGKGGKRLFRSICVWIKKDSMIIGYRSIRQPVKRDHSFLTSWNNAKISKKKILKSCDFEWGLWIKTPCVLSHIQYTEPVFCLLSFYTLFQFIVHWVCLLLLLLRNAAYASEIWYSWFAATRYVCACIFFMGEKINK